MKLLALPVADKYKGITSIDFSVIVEILKEYKARFVINPQNQVSAFAQKRLNFQRFADYIDYN